MQSTYKSRTYALFISVIFVVITALSVVMASHTHAVDYPCGTYSAAEYESDCALEEPAAQSGGSSGGSGSTTSGTSSTSTNDSPAVDSPESIDIGAFPEDAIILNTFEEYGSDTGKRLDVTSEQVIHLTVNSEKHTITVKTITDEYVIVTIASTPTDVKIMLGDIIDYDVDKDGINDLAISYFGPSTGVAVMNFRQLSQPGIVTGTTTDDTAVPASATPTTPNTFWWGWAIIPAVIIIVTAIIWIIAARRRKAAASAQPFNSQPWQ